MTIDDLVNELTDPVAFAEEYCEWYSVITTSTATRKTATGIQSTDRIIP